MTTALLGILATAILATAALAACGAKAPPATTPAPDEVGDGHADGDHVAAPPAPAPAKITADLVAEETAAYESAKPVFGKYCAGCHQQGGKKASAKKLGHLDITTYPFDGHHGMEVAGSIRKALGIGGGKATMPVDKPGIVQGDELELIAAWADAFDAAHAAGAHECMAGHDEHHHREH